tara:strand:- start:541 stop:774 length:234 start_codon:yes stop_codon:yes gene_type:complete
MANLYEDERTLTADEFIKVRLLIEKLSFFVDGVLSCDMSSLKDDNPVLHTALTELQDCWESREVISAYEIWEEDINQ